MTHILSHWGQSGFERSGNGPVPFPEQFLADAALQIDLRAALKASRR